MEEKEDKEKYIVGFINLKLMDKDSYMMCIKEFKNIIKKYYMQNENSQNFPKISIDK